MRSLSLTAVRSMHYSARIGILVAITALVFGAISLVPPIAQNPAYHLFVDGRTCLGIANFGNVASNIGFLIFGLFGLLYVLGRNGRALLATPQERLPYVIFFTGVALVSIGSAYYHADPTNQTLVWDRLPLTVAFMALFAAFIMDRVHFRFGLFVVLPLLLAAGAASIVYWDWTETAGAGDLRPYVLVQFYPILAIPLICLLFPGRCTSGDAVSRMIVWYGFAKLVEHADGTIFAALGNAVSGHTIKHLLAAMAVYEVLRMLRAAEPGRTGSIDQRSEAVPIQRRIV